MAESFSFDVVSDFERQELVNTLDQVKREISQRYDLKGTCLLYTSPSPRDKRQPRMPSSA